MGLTSSARVVLREIYKRHPIEFGKIVQKLLALSMIDLGFRIIEERTVQGVDIDAVRNGSGKKMAIEVKTSVGTEIAIGSKDTEGLKRRQQDGYDTYVAILSLRLCMTHGWIVFPAAKLKPGTYEAIGFVSSQDDEFSNNANSAFTGVLDNVGPGLQECDPGTALSFLKEQYDI